jgi:hypothetical protein
MVKTLHDASEVSFRSPQVVAAALIATVAPLALLLPNSDWFFTREGYLDPWNYVGLFREYLNPDYLPEDYKLARLPWILAGHLVHSVLPPVPAAYTLHGIFLCLTALGMFVGLFALLKRPALAAVVTMCFAFYPPGHGSGGWDYHNTGAGAFYVWTFALLALPATLAGHRAMLVLAGGTAALAIHTNITLVNFLPALAFVYVRSVMLRDGQPIHLATLLRRAGWILSGALVATVALSLLNWEVGRRFLFFTTLLNIVMRFVDEPQNQAAFHQPWSSGWVWTARYLALPCAVVMTGIAFLVFGRRVPRSDGRLADVLVVQFLAMAALWIAWQSAGQTALDVDYFAYVLIPSCFIAIAGMLSRGWPDWCEKRWPVTLMAAFVCLFAGLTLESLPGARVAVQLVAQGSLVAIAALFSLAFAVVLWRPAVVSVAVLLVAFGYGNRLVGESPDYLGSDPCKVQPAVYAAVVDAASWLITIDPLYTRARVWFDESELLRPTGACTILLGHIGYSATTAASMVYVTRAFPMPAVDDVPDGAIDALTHGDRMLAIVTGQSASLDAWQRRLAGLGLEYDERGRHLINVLDSQFAVHAWTIRPPAR